MRACFIEDGEVTGGQPAAIRENTTPATRTGLASIQAQRMSRNGAEERAARYFLARIVDHPAFYFFS